MDPLVFEKETARLAKVKQFQEQRSLLGKTEESRFISNNAGLCNSA